MDLLLYKCYGHTHTHARTHTYHESEGPQEVWRSVFAATSWQKLLQFMKEMTWLLHREEELGIDLLPEFSDFEKILCYQR